MKKAHLPGEPFVLVALLILLICFSGCGMESKSKSGSKSKEEQEGLPKDRQDSVSEDGKSSRGLIPIPASRQINRIYYYLENSESMFGYVEGTTDFKHALRLLVNESEPGIENRFYFVNDSVTDRGTIPTHFLNNLNPNTLKCGGYTNSDLNRLIKMALDSAGLGRVSILITDGIYSISSASDPEDLLYQLQLFQGEIQNIVRERIQSVDLATILVKLQSRFKGSYFPAAGGTVLLNQQRPYYIMIFGEAGLINSTYPDEYLKKLNGFNYSARFFKMEDEPIPFEYCSYKNRGHYRPYYKDKTGSTIRKIQKDREGSFQISVAVNFNHIPFDDRYFRDIGNYTCTNNYEIIEVNSSNTFPLADKEKYLDPFNASHIITLGTIGAPWGQLEIRLTKQDPVWIEQTHTNDDRHPAGNTDQTFGFQFLIQGIVDGYTKASSSDYIGIIKMTLNR